MKQIIIYVHLKDHGSSTLSLLVWSKMEMVFGSQQKGLGLRVTPWQRQNGCHFFSYLPYITGAKFEQHHPNISRDLIL